MPLRHGLGIYFSQCIGGEFPALTAVGSEVDAERAEPGWTLAGDGEGALFSYNVNLWNNL